jgi:hypothetical protein
VAATVLRPLLLVVAGVVGDVGTVLGGWTGAAGGSGRGIGLMSADAVTGARINRAIVAKMTGSRDVTIEAIISEVSGLSNPRAHAARFRA